MTKFRKISKDCAAGESLLSQTKRLLRRGGLQARKGLGQHFLIDREVLKLVTTAAALAPSDVVVEVGPGLGVLTRELAGRSGRIIAVELDSRLVAILERSLAHLNNVTIVNGDVLQLDLEALLREVGLSAGITEPFRYKVVANLPYYITSPVLRHFLEARLRPQIMVLMVQWEVAEAIVASPGEMSVLSVSVQFYGKPVIVGRVPACCFYPAPGVDSAILKIGLYSRPPVAVTDREGFFKVVRAGFSAPRKKVANSLAQGLRLDKAEVLCWLAEADIVSQRRAETLTLEEWVKLWQVFTRSR